MEQKISQKSSVQAALKKLQRYVVFCKDKPYAAFPPTYESVGEFLLMLVRERQGSTRSLANDKSHLKSQCILHDLGWLSYRDDIKLRQLLAVARGDDYSQSQVKDALRFSTLIAIISKLDLSVPEELLKATILACGHNLLLRTAESTSGITAKQVTWLQSSGRLGISLLLLRTKTYLTGSGCSIAVDEFDHPFSAVSLLRRWWKLNDFRHKPDSFLFPAIIRGKINYSQPMTGAFLRKLIKSAVSDLGLNPKRYSGHSLRAGGATDLFASRIPYWVIKKMGRWTSDAALRYYRAEDDVVNSVRKAFSRMSKSVM